MINADYNSFGKIIAYIMANNIYSEILWISLFCVAALSFICLLISYFNNQNNVKEYLLYGSILTIITIGRLPHFSRGFIDGDESIWITNALTLIHDPNFYFSEIINLVRFYSVVPLLLLYPIGINHTTCQLIVIIIFFLTILIICKILALRFEKKNVFVSITPFILLISLLNTYGFIPYNSEHFSILIIVYLVFLVEKMTILRENINKLSMTFIGVLTFVAINCKFQSIIIVSAINLYLFLKVKNKTKITYIIFGFFISYLPFLIIALYYNNTNALYAFWVDNLYYALFGLNDQYKDTLINEVISIFSIPDTKYFYYFSFLLIFIITMIVINKKIYKNEYIAYFTLTLISFYTVIAPQFLFLHYIFYFIFLYFLFFCFLVNIYFKYYFSKNSKILYLLLCGVLPASHILFAGNISFKLSKEKLSYYNSQNFLLSLREKYLKDVTVPKFSILGWNNKYYTDGNFILGSSEMYTTLFELDFPSRKNRYERFIFNLEKRLPEIFCIQAGKVLSDYPDLSLILDKYYTWVAIEGDDHFYILNDCFDT